jgi:glycosyltransferase involved in cell wall biosynthesis
LQKAILKTNRLDILQMLHFPLRGAGAGIYADLLARGLIRRGHSASVLCTDHLRLAREYPVETILFADERNADAELAFDIPVFQSHPVSKGTTFGGLTGIEREEYIAVFRRRIQLALARFHPDIVHVHHGWVIASILADLNVPYVVSLHGTEYKAFKRYPAYRDMARKGLCAARCILALSAEEREHALAGYGLCKSKVVIVPGGTDTDRFRLLDVDKLSVLRELGIQPVNRPVVLLAGRLIDIKGIDTLIRAAQCYQHSAAAPITIIAGQGECREAYEILASQLGVESIYFVGFRNHEMMAKLYNIADVVAIPSREDTFPLVALEALACGTPIVASCVGGLSHIVNPAIGRLVDPDDSAAFATAIDEVIRIQFKRQMSEDAVALVRQNYSFDRVVHRVEEIYAQALSESTVVSSQSSD